MRKGIKQELDRNETIKQRVCKLLGITEECYAKCVEKFGYDYAYEYNHHNEFLTKNMCLTAAYWRWWNRMQYLRDEMFLVEFGDYYGKNLEVDLFDLWLEAHEPHEVEARPTKAILKVSIQLMEQAIERENAEKLTNQ